MEPRRPTTRELSLLACGFVPWGWYVVRDLHAWMDVVAMLWPLLGVGAVVALMLTAALLRSAWVVWIAASWALATTAIVVGQWRPLDTGTPVDPVRIVAANVFGDNTDASGVSAEIDAQEPDVLVINEATNQSIVVFRRGFEHHERVPLSGGKPNGTAVFSDHPMEAGPLPGDLKFQRGMRVEIDAPAGPFVLYAIHLQKPGVRPSGNVFEVGFRTHRKLIDEIVDAIAEEELPVVVAGDLNLVDRTSGYRALTDELDDALRSGWVGPTSLKRQTRLLLARIDHVLMPEDWCSEDGKTFTMRGSDHRGVAATVGPCE